MLPAHASSFNALVPAEGSLLKRQVAKVAEATESNAPTSGVDLEDRHRAVVPTAAQPGLWRQLQRPEEEVADNVHVADDDLVLVPLLILPWAARRRRRRRSSAAQERRRGLRFP